jgi:hypothetical protein
MYVHRYIDMYIPIYVCLAHWSSHPPEEQKILAQIARMCKVFWGKHPTKLGSILTVSDAVVRHGAAWKSCFVSTDLFILYTEPLESGFQAGWPNEFLKIMPCQNTQFSTTTMWKGSTISWATSVILNEPSQSSKRPMGENPPNLVTLISSSNISETEVVCWFKSFSQLRTRKYSNRKHCPFSTMSPIFSTIFRLFFDYFSTIFWRFFDDFSTIFRRFFDDFSTIFRRFFDDLRRFTTIFDDFRRQLEK